MRHSVELIQYINAPGGKISPAVGAAHLGIIVDDLDARDADLPSKGVEFVGSR